MAGSATNKTVGMAITFDSGFFAQILSIAWNGMSRKAIDVSHFGISAPGAGKHGNMLFVPGDLSDPGGLDVEIHFDPDTAPPIDSAAETCTVTSALISGDASAANWAASAFMTDFEYQGQLDDKIVATAKIKFSGNITRTAAA